MINAEISCKRRNSTINMKNRWRIFPVIIGVSICFLYITIIEKFSPLSVLPAKIYEDNAITGSAQPTIENKKELKNEVNISKEVDLRALNPEITFGNSDMDQKQKIRKLDKTYENSMKEMLSKNLTETMIGPTLQSIRLELLKELHESTYEKLLESALQSKPLESRPRPRSVQIVIVTTWRSGSTFLEELIESHPGVYNVYEPLIPFGMRNFYNDKEPDVKDAQTIIGDLLHCRYNKDYISDAKIFTIELFSRNTRVWDACKNKFNHNALCFQEKFLEAACKIFPWSVMKTVRMGLRFLKPFLEDKDLNLQIVYLVRDPRAVINSRLSSVHWCQTRLCYDPKIHCKHMENDYQAMLEFSKLFPGRVHFLRYEDLSLSPMNVTKDLLKKLNLDFDPKMEKFIKSHTTVNYDKPWSTTRESSKRVTHWVPKIKKITLDLVQSACKNVMPHFGYKFIKTTDNISIQDILQENFTIKNI